MHQVGNALTRCKGVGVFGSALLRCEGVRGFGFGIGCSGVIQMTQGGCRQVGIGPIGVGTVTVVTRDVEVWHRDNEDGTVIVKEGTVMLRDGTAIVEDGP